MALEFLFNRVLGVMLWIWLWLFFTAVLLVSIVIYVSRERIKKAYYIFRFPEMVIRVIIHFPGNIYKTYFRLIPSDNIIKIDKKQYLYDGKELQKDDEVYRHKQPKGMDNLLVAKDILAHEIKGKQYFNLEGKSYEYVPEGIRQDKSKRFPELHYLYNHPFPLMFDVEDKELRMTSAELKTFQDNNLITQLLSLKEQRMTMIILIVMVALNILITAFLLSKQMGWIE